jgi:hypothetical protein
MYVASQCCLGYLNLGASGVNSLRLTRAECKAEELRIHYRQNNAVFMHVHLTGHQLAPIHTYCFFLPNIEPPEKVKSSLLDLPEEPAC